MGEDPVTADRGVHGPEGLDLVALDLHLGAVGVRRAGRLQARLIAGGRSNLTFLVSDDASKWVLRRPPLFGRTPSAHDVAREYRVVAALQGTRVPVAGAVTMCNDDTVLDAPFAMVDFVPGRVVRSDADLDKLGGQREIDDCVNALIGVLADLHSVDPAAVGLADFGKPTGYLERQVRRWGSQWELVRLEDDPRDGDIHRLLTALAASVPPAGQPAIVHGDYRIDNTIIDADDPSKVSAVVDWEMSTLGDPLSDAALMCVYRDPAMELILGEDAAWTSPLLPSADSLAHRYCEFSNQSLRHWNFYLALAYLKLAVIAAGIDFRRRRSGADDRTDRVGEAVAPLIATGIRALSLRR